MISGIVCIAERMINYIPDYRERRGLQALFNDAILKDAIQLDEENDLIY